MSASTKERDLVKKIREMRSKLEGELNEGDREAVRKELDAAECGTGRAPGRDIP